MDDRKLLRDRIDAEVSGDGGGEKINISYGNMKDRRCQFKGVASHKYIHMKIVERNGNG